MERCPNCAARLTESPVCRRCGMDLSRLLQTERAAERLAAQGARHLLAGDPDAARQALARSLGLRTSPLAGRLLDFARLGSQGAKVDPGKGDQDDFRDSPYPTESAERLSEKPCMGEFIRPLDSAKGE